MTEWRQPIVDQSPLKIVEAVIEIDSWRLSVFSVGIWDKPRLSSNHSTASEGSFRVLMGNTINRAPNRRFRYKPGAINPLSNTAQPTNSSSPSPQVRTCFSIRPRHFGSPPRKQVLRGKRCVWSFSRLPEERAR
ncbi:hypothetical protein PoB_003576800 [Plakobranchus ocellatus]|uniref:Uncharacterized protein n=1 Tax=Plakobranchus ocellatus TaxID=259542 RepID=A0AAV4APH2_9GAST|nr:hypothetical protein PoB_003576800 [Plakobranchus ocellatus]